jgi:hypothetical protein
VNGGDPEERLTDIIAGHFGFYPRIARTAPVSAARGCLRVGCRRGLGRLLPADSSA